MTYSVVQLGDDRRPISGIVHTNAAGEQRVVAFDVAEGYADKVADFLNLAANPAAGPIIERLANLLLERKV